MATNIDRWNALHGEQRHRLRWPSEHVVRFLTSLEHVGDAVDIGCGSGRHLWVICDLADTVAACDPSEEAREASSTLVGVGVQAGEMTCLPYDDGSFDTAVAYGVFYYGSAEDCGKAVSELHRVLRPGGNALVVVRTVGDWRNKLTKNGVFECAGEPEDGMQMHFLKHTDIPDVYGAFSNISYEVTTTSTHDRQRVNCDWLITVTK